MNIAAFVSGLLFALGLAVGGMTQPDKVIGFLDFFGSWDPTLVFVMGGAVMTYGIGLRIILKRPAPLYAASFQIPTSQLLTPRLVGGSAMFGIGWGLGGFCPGPGLASIMTGAPTALVFVATMFAGMALHRVLTAERSPKPSTQAASR